MDKIFDQSIAIARDGFSRIGPDYNIEMPKLERIPRIEYIVPSGQYEVEEWPDSFFIDPKVGDMVESNKKSVLKITAIVHKMGGRISIELSRELGGSSAQTGGGGSSGDIL